MVQTQYHMVYHVMPQSVHYAMHCHAAYAVLCHDIMHFYTKCRYALHIYSRIVCSVYSMLKNTGVRQRTKPITFDGLVSKPVTDNGIIYISLS